MAWRIWYWGGKVVDGESPSDWIAAPYDGVVCIGVRNGQDGFGRSLSEVLSGSDWYWMADGQLGQSGTSSLTPGEWLPSGAPAGAIEKQGRLVPDDEMASCTQAMLEWVG